MRPRPEPHVYLVALGSNMRHVTWGAPERIVEAALVALAKQRMTVQGRSPIIRSRPIGPSSRAYANAVAVLTSMLDPPGMLDALQAIEAEFGRKRRGQSWQARTLDLDIIHWSGGAWCDDTLTVPHPAFRQRRFVLAPACVVAGVWRDPITGLTVRQLLGRLDRKRPPA